MTITIISFITNWLFGGRVNNNRALWNRHPTPHVWCNNQHQTATLLLVALQNAHTLEGKCLPRINAWLPHMCVWWCISLSLSLFAWLPAGYTTPMTTTDCKILNFQYFHIIHHHYTNVIHYFHFVLLPRPPLLPFWGKCKVTPQRQSLYPQQQKKKETIKTLAANNCCHEWKLWKIIITENRFSFNRPQRCRDVRTKRQI